MVIYFIIYVDYCPIWYENKANSKININYLMAVIVVQLKIKNNKCPYCRETMKDILKTNYKPPIIRKR